MVRMTASLEKIGSESRLTVCYTGTALTTKAFEALSDALPGSLHHRELNPSPAALNRNIAALPQSDNLHLTYVGASLGGLMAILEAQQAACLPNVVDVQLALVDAFTGEHTSRIAGMYRRMRGNDSRIRGMASRLLGSANKDLTEEQVFAQSKFLSEYPEVPKDMQLPQRLSSKISRIAIIRSQHDDIVPATDRILGLIPESTEVAVYSADAKHAEITSKPEAYRPALADFFASPKASL